MLNYKVKGLVARAKIMLIVHQKVTQIFSAHLPNWPKHLGYFEKKALMHRLSNCPQFFEFRWSSSYVMIEPYYIYVDVFCTHLFLHTVKSKAAGDLALNFIFTVSVKCLPSQVCFNFLSELANGRSTIENRTSKF